MRIFVGNLPWEFSSEDLRRLFAEYGDVTEASVIGDRATGRSRCFGFVAMGATRQGKAAIEALDGATVKGRQIRVNVARDRAPNPLATPSDQAGQTTA